MSERNHSPDVASGPRSAIRRRLTPVFAGTIGAVVGAAILFQFLRAEPAHSQTQPPAGKAAAQPAAGQQVLARVNNQPIHYDAVARECVARHGKEVLENLINRLLIQQECDRQGVTVSRDEVGREVQEIAKKFNLPAETWYQMLQSERGLTPQQYQDDVIWPMLALKKLAGSEFKPTKSDMELAFKRDYGPRVKARLILIEGNIRQANQTWEECNANPDDFDRLAREKSADANTRPLGGVIPPIRMSGGADPIEAAAFRLHEGEISPVVEIGQSKYVILKCEGRTEPVVTDIKDVWDELYKQVVEEKTQTAVAKVFEGVRDKAQIQNFLADTATGRPRTAAPNGVKPASGEAPGAARARPAARTADGEAAGVQRVTE
ncbi:MAG: SurA N-terminal domain-containing protein [Planctomyces sp.]|nr:SurA N-terminal domain-containing protein [Planctomyces sp.]